MNPIIHFSNHAIARYRERVEPGEKLNHVKIKLTLVADSLQVSKRAPRWVLAHPRGEPSRRWAVLDEDTAFVLKRVKGGWIAVTCLTRGDRPEGMATHHRREDRPTRGAERRAWRERRAA